MRLSLGTALVIALVAPAAAQVMVSPAFSKEKQKPKAEVKSQPMTIHAAGEPDPALRYRFWPAPEYRRQGNPMPFVSRAVLLAVQAKHDPTERREFVQSYERFMNLPLEELPGVDVPDFLSRYGGAALRELERAENLLDVDYDLLLDELSASEMISTVLPELQESRSLARILSLRARLAVAEERWDDFVRDIRLGFRLAEIIGNSNDCLIGRLVGYAISGVMMGVIEEAIQQPRCPNLYWALASLPELRLSEIRDSLEFESALVARIFKNVRTLPDTAIGEEAARMKLLQLVEEAGRTMESYDSKQSVAAAQMVAGFYVVTMAEPSRELLAATKTWGGRAHELSSSEAVLRAMQLKFDRMRDNWVKWSLLPPEMWDDFRDQAETQIKPQNRADIIQVLVAQLQPAIHAARRASQRMIQNRNKLLTIEALRMYAAINNSLPESIDKLRPVPAWNDGLTYKPFGYARTSDTSATLLVEPRYPGDKDHSIQIQLVK